ncbi:MAG: phosphoenolpyruvate synthase/pyruvate phosphate dikinase [Desulfobulbus sp.]|nr:MAG: phosphoenolpyruvate synthase/pyruvate phosphate dikinase [Desulfobulbus sp.]
MLTPLQQFKTHDPHFKIFHELMAFKVQEILLVSSPYDAYILEEDGSLASRIINEYHGLNLSRPPRITWVPTADQALDLLSDSHFDLVVTMPHLGGMDGSAFACRVKRLYPLTPIILLAHSARDAIIMGDKLKASCFDDSYIWCCDSDILLAIVKTTEDRINAARDTRKAMVRVILLVEDSPVHRSALLPMLYNEVVRQTQGVLDEGLNEQHRLLKMRARPKILTASCYEEAMELFKQYQDYLFCVMSDVRFPRAGKLSGKAGYDLLETIRTAIPDLPLLMLSTEPENRDLARNIPAVFIDKNTETMREELHSFFLNYLGFGDFVFRSPGGLELNRASRLRDFETALQTLPEDSLLYHAHCNHFSNWVMARAEIVLAARLHKNNFPFISDSKELRKYLISEIHSLRKSRQQGVVAQFSADTFDKQITDFARMGNGSLGGKARGIAFMFSQLSEETARVPLLTDNKVVIPQTCVITSQGFTDFVQLNNLHRRDDVPDPDIAQQFLQGRMPDWLLTDLDAYLEKIHYPLSVRSSGLLEDAQFRPYAGLYQTYMLENNSQEKTTRLDQLVQAIKLVYASTWFESPRAFSRSVGQARQDAMAVIIQQLVGSYYEDYFYPAVSGVAQSYNYYPIAPMRSEDGIAHLALGFGKTVVEGEQSLRFSPAFPKHLPQFSTVDDMLANSQRQFYCMDNSPSATFVHENSNLVLRNIDDALQEFPVRYLSSTYLPEEHRIRDADLPGPKVVTFAALLKYNTYPLPALLKTLLSIGREGMGCEVEIEFAVDMSSPSDKPVFYFLQIRPIVTNSQGQHITISRQEREKGFLWSDHALGHGLYDRIRDIVFVSPETFDTAVTRDICREIGAINRKLHKLGRQYLLIGPGRWGTADPWLGIPVQWADISGVGAIVEVQDGTVRAEASQGTHFFQNITSLGIPYLMAKDDPENKTPTINWDWLHSRKAEEETRYVTHVSFDKPFMLKVDGTASRAVAFFPFPEK